MTRHFFNKFTEFCSNKNVKKSVSILPVTRFFYDFYDFSDFFTFACNAKSFAIASVASTPSFSSVFQKRTDKSFFTNISSFVTEEACGPRSSLWIWHTMCFQAMSFKQEHVESCFPVTRLLYLHHHSAYGYHPWQGCGLPWLRHQHRRCEYCEIFKNTYFEKHLWTATSVFKHLW